jgi:hypothetical protein
MPKARLEETVGRVKAVFDLVMNDNGDKEDDDIEDDDYRR